MPLTPDGRSAALFAGNAAGTLRLIGYVVAACVLMVADHRFGILGKTRYAASAIVEPVYELAALPGRAVDATADALRDRSTLVDDNARLRESLLLANARLHRMQTLVGQNRRLKQLLDVQRRLSVKVQLARVMGVDPGGFRFRIMIDAGTDDGVSAGMVVIDAHGVTGQVVAALRRTAQVMLITDPNSALPVVDQRSGVRAIAYGAGASGQLRLPTVPLTADIKVGDLLLTSGLGGRFPAGMPVGEVESIAPNDDGSFAAALVRPAAELNRSSEVLLLHDQPPVVGPPAPAPAFGPPADRAPPAAQREPRR